MSASHVPSPADPQMRVNALPATDVLGTWHRATRALEAAQQAQPLPARAGDGKPLQDGIEAFLEGLIPLCASDPRMSRIARRREARLARRGADARDAHTAPGLDEAFGELCAGCGALAPGPASAPLKAELTQLALQALPGCRDPRAAMHRAMVSREAGLIRAVAARFPERAGWTGIAYAAPTARPGTLAHELNLECLDALAAIGVAPADTLDIVATRAISLDRGDALDWLDHAPGRGNKSPWPNKHIRARILDCGPGCAGHLRRHLDDRIARAGSQGSVYAFYSGLFPRNSIKTRHFDLKVFAALLSSRQDITGLFRERDQDLHPRLERLIGMTASAHGQLRLQTLEPDPVALLGRKKSADFFRLGGRTFHLDDSPQALAGER